MTTPHDVEADVIEFEPIKDLTGTGEARNNVAVLAELFPDAVADGRVDLDVLRDLLGEQAELAGSEASGLRWVGMAEARRLSTVPATSTLLPRPDESVNWESTKNIVVEGDNLEVLRLLRRGYTNKVDVIYIDPPYNIDADTPYVDDYKETATDYEREAGLRDSEGALQSGSGSSRAQDRRTGAAQHTKWLSMMYPRLLVSHSLLAESGVLIVAIDDSEHARLKLLLDRIFGSENFVANVVWQGGRKNDSRFVSVGHDYMLIYAKNATALTENDNKWRESRPADAATRQAARSAWDNSGHDPQRAKSLMKEWIASLPAGHPAKENNRFYEFETDGRVFRKRDISWPGGGGPTYDVLHPATGLPVQVPSRGWIYSKPERMQEDIDAGLIMWGKDHTEYINRKTYLDSEDGAVPTSVFEKKRTSAPKALESLIGSDIFPYPKDVDVLARWIGLATSRKADAFVLDFFAGSGSTGHAVMDLNAADGGNRRYVLVQLDEPVHKDGYATIADITRERLRRAGKKIAESLTLESAEIDLGFRSYQLAPSNIRPWDGTGELSLIEAVDNLVEGRTTDDLLVEMMLRLGIDLTTPVDTQPVAASTLYCLGGGTLYAFFGENVTTEQSNEVARALVAWRDVNPVESDVTIVVRDTGFVDSSAKLNLDAAVKQAGFTTFRSI